MTYEIKDLGALENNVTELATINQKLAEIEEQISIIITNVSLSWANDSGADVQAVLEGLNTCDRQLSKAIVPTIKEYVATMYKLANETKTSQNKTL